MTLPTRAATKIPDVGGSVVADPSDANMTPIPSILSKASAAAADLAAKKKLSAKEAIQAIKEAERWENLEKARLEREAAERKQKEEQEAVRRQLEAEEKERKRLEEEEALKKIDRAKVWIAADNEAIYDWQRHKMIVVIPVNQSCRPHLERTLCEKMKWNDMNGYTFYKALGSSADTVEPSDEVMQSMLSPQQLRMTITGTNFVMVRKTKKSEEPQVLAYDYFLRKADAFLELYDPQKRDLAPQMLREFVGNEQDLIDAFLRRYGPEPTMQQLMDKRAFLKRQRELQEAAAERARKAGLTNSIKMLSEREKANVMRILEKLAYTRIMKIFYRKWQAAVRKRRLSDLICHLSNAHLEKNRRKEYFGKLKLFAENKKNKRQLAASSQIAIRNETLLGDLASENMGLKNEIRKLQAHIEVLSNASNKRLETLYGGAETAVVELKRLTAELRHKAVTAHVLEGKCREAAERVAAANKARDDAAEICNAKMNEFNAQDAEYRSEQGVINAQIMALHEKIEMATEPVKGAGITCKHCPHYHGIMAQSEINRSTIEQLRNRIENSESMRRALQAAVERLKLQKENVMADGGGGGNKGRSGTAGGKSGSHDGGGKGGGDGPSGPSLPQVLLDVEERRRRLAAGEYDIDIPLTPALLALLLPEEREKYKKIMDSLAQPKSASELLAEEHRKKLEAVNALKDKEGGEDGRATSAGGESSSSSGGGGGSSAVAGSILGPVGRADLRMDRYFNGEVERSRDRVKAALEKRWELKPKTPFGQIMDNRFKEDAAEAAKQAQYALTRREALNKGIIVATSASRAIAGTPPPGASAGTTPKK